MQISGRGLAESDRLNDFQVDGEPRLAEWLSLMVRAYASITAEDDAGALAAAMQMDAIGRTLSRYADDTTRALKARVLLNVGRHEEALAAAEWGLDSQVTGQNGRVNSLLPAAQSLAALGRYEAALDVVEEDFGPILATSQRSRSRTSSRTSSPNFDSTSPVRLRHRQQAPTGLRRPTHRWYIVSSSGSRVPVWLR